jgi:hypothetical protein
MSSVPYPGGNDPTAGDDDVPRVTDGMGWKEVIRVGEWKTRVWWDLAVVSRLVLRRWFRADDHVVYVRIGATL